MWSHEIRPIQQFSNSECCSCRTQLMFETQVELGQMELHKNNDCKHLNINFVFLLLSRWKNTVLKWVIHANAYIRPDAELTGLWHVVHWMRSLPNHLDCRIGTVLSRLRQSTVQKLIGGYWKLLCIRSILVY